MYYKIYNILLYYFYFFVINIKYYNLLKNLNKSIYKKLYFFFLKDLVDFCQELVIVFYFNLVFKFGICF